MHTWKQELLHQNSISHARYQPQNWSQPKPMPNKAEDTLEKQMYSIIFLSKYLLKVV